MDLLILSAALATSAITQALGASAMLTKFETKSNRVKGLSFHPCVHRRCASRRSVSLLLLSSRFPASPQLARKAPRAAAERTSPADARPAPAFCCAQVSPVGAVLPP